MKIKMTALELILHLAEGSTTPNTLQHITKIAKATLDEMKEQEEMQPFKYMTNESYLRGVHDGRMATQRTWVGLSDEELSEVYNQADWDTVNGWEYERAIEAKLRSKNENRN